MGLLAPDSDSPLSHPTPRFYLPPRHRKDLVTRCHGEEPHVVGWRFINERRAVNLDAACGWARGKADVLYVAGAFEVMRKLRKLL